ncbi:hypothetical protein [Thermaurantiacus sp.]|uniref:hypothetical protein n=1 Tax=Thermaurantiacus sp. TaxID=2820283 RepID=UPI00298F2588|nr:hypothetical protein [Thermaurantiacus sp.]
MSAHAPGSGMTPGAGFGGREPSVVSTDLPSVTAQYPRWTSIRIRTLRPELMSSKNWLPRSKLLP